MNKGPTNSGPVEKRYLMVLEDNDLIGDQFVRWLKTKFPTKAVKRARSIAEAQELLNQLDFDFFLLDIHLPDGNGIDFLCDVKMVNPSARVIVMTATPLPEFRDKALSLGTIRFMEKPVDMGILESELNRQLVETSAQISDTTLRRKTKDTTTLRRRESASGTTPESQGTRAETPKGFRAILEGITLLDLIQLKCLGRYSTQLEFSCADGVSGKIYLDNGQIIHAVAPGCEGVKALHTILSWHHGSVQEDRKGPTPSQRTIEGDWQVLLMEAAQAIDEGTLSP